MNGQILNNIYDVLSNDPNVQLESKDFESWKSSFLQNEEIVGNVYNYLINKKLTNSSPEQWVKNIQDELDAQQPKQVKQKIEQPNPEEVARKEIMSQLPFQQMVGKGILDIFDSLGKKEEREQLKTNVKNWWKNLKPQTISRLKKIQQSGTRFIQDVYDDKAIDLLMSSEDDVRFKGQGKKWFSTDEAKVQFVDPDTGERVSEKSNPDNYRRLSNLNALGDIEIDRFYGDTDIKVGEFTDDYIVNKQKEIDKQEKLVMESGGFVKGVKGGSAADVVGGTLNFISSAFTSYIPAYLSRGLTLYPDIVAPFISDFNNEKAKTLYGKDNPDALKQLYDNDEDELITPMAIGLLARKLEDIGFKGIKKYIRSNPKKGNAIMGYITTGSKEGVTELGQEGLDEFNNSIAKGDDVVTASGKMINAMASERGLEAFIGGFIGSVSISASGKAVNRALISDNASVKEINSKINYISDLTYAKNETRDKDVKNAIDFEIQQAEQELKDYINEKRKVSEILNEDQKSSLVDIMNQKDDIRTKVEKLQQQLNNEEISNKEFGYAFRSLNNQDKRLTEQIELINESAKEQLLQTGLEATKEQGEKIGLKQELFETKEQYAAIFGKKGSKKYEEALISDGHISEDGKTYFVNMQTAREAGAIGVGSHELLHGIIGRSFSKLDPEAKKRLNENFLNLLSEKDRATVLSRLAFSYGITGEEVFQTEELYTAFSDEIIDGGVKFNEGVFGKVKNAFEETLRQLSSAGYFSEDGLTKFLYRKEFSNARQAYNFVKDYSLTIKKTGKVTERATEFAKEDPGRDEEAFSKQASDNVQRIYEDQGVGGALDIIEQFKPITNKIVERRREAPGFDKQLLTDEIETGKRGILDLIQEYDPESGVPLAAYINKFLPSRAIEASRRVLGEEFTEDVAERVDVAAEEVVTEVKAKPKPRKIILSDRLGVKNKVDKAIKQKLPELDIEKLNFKTLKDQAPEVTGEMFGISPKKLVSLANITKKELQSAQMFINKNADVLISMLPEGATTGGTATGVPKTLLKEFYTKSDRAKMAKTGTKAGLAIQVKNPNITKKQFLEVFGIIDGKPDRTDRNTSARVLALANLTGKMMTNQAVREQFLEQGKPLDAIKHIADGKSTPMFSKSLRNLSAAEETIFWDGLGEASTIMNPALKNLLDSKVVKDILKQVYGDQIRDKNLTAIAKDIVKLLEKYQPAISKNKTIDETTWSEFVANSFMEEANNVIKVLNLEIDGKPVKSAASLYDNIKNIEQGRRVFVDIGNTLLKKYGPKKAARQIAILKGMYANNAKVGRGMFKTDMKTLKVVPVKLKKGKEFGSPRNQIFESVPVFNAYVNKIEGKNEAETKAFQEAYKNVKPLYNQDSKSAVKDKDYKGRLKEAQEAREIIDDVMSMLDNDLDIAMFMISNLSSMKTPLRRAANLRYIADAVLDMDVSKLGKLAEYEHMIPANYMALKIIDAYKNKGGIKNLDDFYKNYNVAIIPKTMDNVLKQQGLQSKMLAGYDFENDASWTRYYNILTNGFEGIVDIRDISSNEVIGPKVSFSKSFRAADTFGKAVDNARTVSEPRGITVLDFDDTLATTESLVKYTTPEGETGTLNAEQYASTYEDLLDKGYTFDFSDFNKVVKGKLAPLFNKAMKLQGKFGPKNMFVLTARPPAAQKPIFDFLKANGLNIPLENITGLGNSTSEAKALWIADKVADGYNDFYFADDALQNVQAVKNMLDQFDVKSKVQQAKVKFSKSAGKEFNDILEQTKGLPSDYMISQAKARQRGKRKGLFQFFVPPSADDFAGLLQMFQGKGKQGMEHAAWFKKNLLDPFARGDRSLNGARQRTAEEFKALRKKFPEVSKKLRKVIPTGDYTFGDAIRVYLWDKNGIEVPGLTKTDQNNMLKLVKADPEIQAFADVLGVISRKEDGYIAPDEYWMTKDIVADITEDGIIGDGRKDHLAEWIENKDLIFTPENLNKIEFLYGSNFREALEDILYRMENGTSRPVGSNRVVNNFLNWMNGGISVVMNWNTRSAVLQTLSTVNFINWGDNNILAAGKAFANQKQYWKDFAFLFNSDMLKQRRAGLKTTIESRELMSEVEGAVNPVRAAIRYLLRIGFTPTKFADSFAIASGGASFYRNRINTYKKQGYNQTEAEAKAFIDFQETAEEGQQSSRPDRLSQQQTSVLGRLILAFQNTPMQYVRMSKKEILDLVNGRFTGFTGPNSFASKTGKIMYYTAVQNLIFYSMQTALFAAMFSDEEDDEEFFDKKTERIFDNMADGVLRGMGVSGAVISTLKNIILKYIANKDSKMYDESAILMEGLKLSPPLSIKARQLLSADKTMRYNRDVIKQMETFDIDNPMWNAAFNVVEMTTNAPLSRMESKYKNVRNALDNRYETWQRVAFMLGYNTWSLGVKNEEIEAIKKEIKAIKTYERKKKAQEEKQAKQAEKQALINKDVEKEKKLQEEGKLKDPKCRHVNTKGERCSVSVANAGDLCTIHEEVLQRADGKKTRCKQVKADGKRCGMQTSNKSGYCYYHD